MEAQANDWLMPRVERQGVLRHIRECDHFWVDYVTLHMPQQGPPLQIEACRLCGVQRKKPEAQSH